MTDYAETERWRESAAHYEREYLATLDELSDAVRDRDDARARLASSANAVTECFRTARRLERELTGTQAQLEEARSERDALQEKVDYYGRLLAGN